MRTLGWTAGGLRSQWPLVAAACLAASLLAAPATAQAGTGRGSVSVLPEGAFEVHRLGGADLYDTSLLIAGEMVHRLGGKVPGVVVASGRSWQHAAVGASLAGGLDLPLLLVPPGGLRSSALRLLEDAGVTEVFAIGGASVIPETDLGGIRDLGVRVERVGDDDPIAAALAAASLGPAGEPARSSAPEEPALTGTPDTVTGLGTVRSLPSRAAVLARVDASGDAHVAAPFAARARLPLLLTSRGSLDAATTRFLDEQAITHVVLSGAHGPPSDSLRDDLDALGISVVQLGNFGSLPTSAAAAGFSTDDSTGQFASWSRRPCPRQPPPTVGLASNRGVWDAFSAAPLLGHLCAPLLLTSPNDLGTEANAALYRALNTGTNSLLIFGGRAVISSSAADQASSPKVPIRVATVTGGTAAGESDQAIVVIDENRRQRWYLSNSGFSVIWRHSLNWSPQRRHIAFTGVRDGTAGVFVLDVATGKLWQVTPSTRDYWTPDGYPIAWSSDGSMLAVSASFDESVQWRSNRLTKVYVADIRDGSLRRLTFDDKRELHAGWAPLGHRLLVLSYPSEGWDGMEPDKLLVVDTDTKQITAVDRYPAVNRPSWSPDGSMIAMATWSERGGTDMAHPSIQVISAQEPHRTLVDGPIDRILAWEPSGCCIAIFNGYYANDISLLDIATGQSRVLVSEGGHDYPEGGARFRGWSPSGDRLLASSDAHTQGSGWWIVELFVIDATDGESTRLTLDGPTDSPYFAGFSPDGQYIAYGASSSQTFQLRIVETSPGGSSWAALDLSAQLPRISGISDSPSHAAWRQFRWTDYGIHSVVIHYDF